MLHMVDKIRLLLIYLLLKITVFAGQQSVDISLNLTHPGASQQMINDKMIIDLGFLKQNTSYTGSNQIKIGTVVVKITQSMTTEDTDSCLLKDMEFNSVNLKKLVTHSEKISTADKFYVGSNSNSIILTASNIKGILTQGNLSAAEDEYFFVAQECLAETGMEGVALTSLQYEFDLYADITGNIPIGSVTGAFSQDTSGVAISIKDLISNQIKSSNLTPYRRRK